ncbi:hypothetical protein BDP27DRAFT_1424011 [Rhodocollybia butyracea]|uniref:Uncharacterized protein n=1 Tax=Rhodocollybia butyracea TaxID=206335 RepID=A0A9P5U527_9AGAR|nr:hypothetical protein BDP27DRAFT_1424011 [Rhodocollybia butyracea]
MADSSTVNFEQSEPNINKKHSCVLQTFRDIDFQSGTTLHDQVEALSTKLFSNLSPLTASMNHALIMHSKPIPDPITTLIRECSGRQDLWIMSEDHDIVLVSFVAKISPYPLDSKLGAYLDMDGFNGTIGVDSFRRACAKIYLSEPCAPTECSNETQEIYQKNKERFFDLLNFLQDNTTQYMDHNAKEDSEFQPKFFGAYNDNEVVERLYPNHTEPLGISTWEDIHRLGHFGLVCKTVNIFENVPSNSTKAKTSVQLMKFYGGVPDPAKLRAAEREKNMRAFDVQYPLEAIEDIHDRKLGHWPDPDGLIRTLAGNNDFSDVTLRIPAMYDSKGALVHPIDYEGVFEPGSMVHVTLSHRMSDITKGLDGGPVSNPNRLCSNVIESMRILSDNPGDLRLWMHGDAINERNRIMQEVDNKVAEDAIRYQIHKEERDRTKDTPLKASEVSLQKPYSLTNLHLQSAITCSIAAGDTTLTSSDSSSSTLLSSISNVVEAVQPTASSFSSAVSNKEEDSSPRKRRPTTEVIPVGVKGRGHGDSKRPKQGAGSTSVDTNV